MIIILTREASWNTQLDRLISQQLPYSKKQERNYYYYKQPYQDFEYSTRKLVKTYLIQLYKNNKDTLMELESQKLKLFDKQQKTRVELEEDFNQIIEGSENKY